METVLPISHISKQKSQISWYMFNSCHEPLPLSCVLCRGPRGQGGAFVQLALAPGSYSLRVQLPLVHHHGRPVYVDCHALAGPSSQHLNAKNALCTDPVTCKRQVKWRHIGVGWELFLPSTLFSRGPVCVCERVLACYSKIMIYLSLLNLDVNLALIFNIYIHLISAMFKGLYGNEVSQFSLISWNTKKQEKKSQKTH